MCNQGPNRRYAQKRAQSKKSQLRIDPTHATRPLDAPWEGTHHVLVERRVCRPFVVIVVFVPHRTAATRAAGANTSHRPRVV